MAYNPPMEITEGFEIPEEELQLSYARAGGPGGQHVNKAETKVVLHWDLPANSSLPEGVRRRFGETFKSRMDKKGVVILYSQSYRERQRNVEEVREKLREMLLSVWKPPKKRRKTKPTRSSIERRLKEKQRTSERKQSRGKVSRDD